MHTSSVTLFNYSAIVRILASTQQADVIDQCELSFNSHPRASSLNSILAGDADSNERARRGPAKVVFSPRDHTRINRGGTVRVYHLYWFSKPIPP
jgi:hypothetical protein